MFCDIQFIYWKTFCNYIDLIFKSIYRNGLIHFEAHEIVLDSEQNSKNPKIEEFKIDGTPITIMIITDNKKGKIIERIEGDDDSGIEKHLRNHFGECSEN